MPRDIETVENVVFMLYAKEDDMVEAEKAVLGFAFCHLSELDWYPSDEDDEKPDDCDRVISYYPGKSPNKNVLRDMFKIAAYLGDRCWLSVHISSKCVHTSVDTNGTNRMSIFESHLNNAMRKRIDRAVSTLTGYGNEDE